MKLRIENDFVYDENGTIVAVLTDYCPSHIKREIAFGSEALPMVREFIASTNRGSFRPKSTIDRFRNLLDKYDLKETA